jgi:ergothioneine biosynthesis protein EgtB
MSAWIAEPLEVEDMVPQSMPDASPTKWHMAHTTWFFETFVLRQARADEPDHHPDFNFLFNSYYNAVGPQFPRPARGSVTRPTVKDVYAYRRHTEERIDSFLRNATDEEMARFGPVIELGIHHEQQHQELMLTDLRHLLAQNPLHPAYRSGVPAGSQDDESALEEPGDGNRAWARFEGGLAWIGHAEESFAFDNELPRHQTLLAPFEMATSPVTCGEWLAFMADGGYDDPAHWLSDGWAVARREGWGKPMYWSDEPIGWRVYTLRGLEPLSPEAPVCNVSFYEADAFARWAGARLPTEFEWEHACSALTTRGEFLDGGALHPIPVRGDGVSSMLGGVWEWTASPYVGYPGYRPAEGAIGEYNGKFMCDQHVLRGGSVATPASHIRPTYRNFFPAHARWQFSGLRLARDAS